MLSLFLFLILFRTSAEDVRMREIADEYSIAICMLAVGNGGFGLPRLCLALAVLILSGLASGMGDAKLLAALSLLLGTDIIDVMIFAFASAALYSLSELACGRLSLGDSIAFAPFISAPAIAVFVCNVI